MKKQFEEANKKLRKQSDETIGIADSTHRILFWYDHFESKSISKIIMKFKTILFDDVVIILYCCRFPQCVREVFGE